MATSQDDQMEEERFREITAQFIQPLFTGAELGSDNAPKTSRKLVSYVDQCTIAFRPTPDAPYRLTLKRSQPFEEADADVVKAFIVILRTLQPLWEKASLRDLIRASMHRVIARAMTGPSDETRPLRSTIADVLLQFESWAEQTYEGRRISAAIGLEPAVVKGAGVAISEVYQEDFGAVLAAGLETFLTVSADGFVSSYEPLPTQAPNIDHLFAPLRFARIAEWTESGRIGIGLNRNGEILVFKDKALVFCKRRGSWHHFTHSAVIKRIALERAIPSDVCSAIYETALDVSFARSGGCIAVVRRTQADDFREGGVVAKNDLIATGSGVKARCLREVIGTPFQDLDRRLRAEILAIDGATVLSYQGEVLAAGAIVKVPAGSSGGGRLAATKALAHYGLAMKISSDGAIRVFAKKGEKVEETASVG
jgi:hypothetical protein